MEIYYSSLVIMAYLFLTVNIAYSRNIDYSNNNITSRRANIYNQLNKQYPYLSHNEIIKLTLQKLQEERIITTSTTTAQPTKQEYSFREVTPLRYYNCPHCTRKFWRGSAYKYHLDFHKRHGIKVDYSWILRLNTTFDIKRRKERLRRLKLKTRKPTTPHIGVTVTPYAYKCRYCSTRCVRGSGYGAHLRAHERRGYVVDYGWIKRIDGINVRNRDTSILRPLEVEGQYICQICSKNCWDGSGFAAHLRHHEREGYTVDYSWILRRDNPCWEPQPNRLYPIVRRKTTPTPTIKPMSPIKVYRCRYCLWASYDGCGFAAHLRAHERKGVTVDYSWKYKYTRKTNQTKIFHITTISTLQSTVLNYTGL